MGTAAAFRSRAASLGLKTVYDAGTQNPPDDSKTSKSGLFRCSSAFLGTIDLLTRIFGIRFSTPRPGYACCSAACVTLDAAAYARPRSGPPGAHQHLAGPFQTPLGRPVVVISFICGGAPCCRTVVEPRTSRHNHILERPRRHRPVFGFTLTPHSSHRRPHHHREALTSATLSEVGV
jgi:hypothetical protein